MEYAAPPGRLIPHKAISHKKIALPKRSRKEKYADQAALKALCPGKILKKTKT
jgi:hypothetical protein